MYEPFQHEQVSHTAKKIRDDAVSEDDCVVLHYGRPERIELVEKVLEERTDPFLMATSRQRDARMPTTMRRIMSAWRSTSERTSSSNAMSPQQMRTDSADWKTRSEAPTRTVAEREKRLTREQARPLGGVSGTLLCLSSCSPSYSKAIPPKVHRKLDSRQGRDRPIQARVYADRPCTVCELS